MTMISRLEQRGWLERREAGRSLRYVVACTREQATGQVATQLVDMVFGGSASELVRSLLGSRPVSAEEVRRLRELLDKMETEGQP
jgi:predicted transcriptional regulator